MKKILFLIFISFGLLANAQFKKANLRASGLTCAMCSKAVYKSLSSIAFVEKINVDIQKSTYEIVFKTGMGVDFDALSRAVVDAGFSVAQLQVTSVFNGIKAKKGSQVEVDGKMIQFINGNDQLLNGEKTFNIVDKNFVSAKEFKKYSASAGKTYESGFADGKRVYHAIL
ncbi:MAG: heavy-metal-associated domain-containing protein [Chitinophagaceae bacterium]|nr:heavy-metal-associated domain-containing protein [Chitinophagaceae bacterium]